MKDERDPKGGRGRILLCEDEPIVAMDVKMIIEAEGYSVLGAFARVERATEAAVGAEIDGAVLDVRLRDGDVFPLAEELAKRGIPMIFHSGHILESELRERFPGASFCPKPSSPDCLVEALAEICAARSEA